MTEQLLQQQLESPSGTGRVEPRSNHQPDSNPDHRTGCQPAEPILTGSSALLVRPEQAPGDPEPDGDGGEPDRCRASSCSACFAGRLRTFVAAVVACRSCSAELTRMIHTTNAVESRNVQFRWEVSDRGRNPTSKRRCIDTLPSIRAGIDQPDP